ncbi:type VI immunity family protein [Pyxidicoccus xibeiensis]|uniref:type VI immunity family protein n=1 Tax=Pyxidicoccus xibeiensis TaxID=2906759 RepID=UPI0020A7C848|nr:type VI immunity family protein [Pyxidicoccus xibeiensis]MCP3141649.1 DUF3396 domain-containing protein [Pyxidicoccus xibeiensis]
MSEHFPRLRIHTESGHVLIREGLNATFYMKRPHSEIAQGMLRSFEAYLRAVGPSALTAYADLEGYWQQLDTKRWGDIWQELRHPHGANVQLTDTASRENRFEFAYQGRALDDPSLHVEPDEACFVSYWLPSELLEERGPQWVRELLLELAAPLPFNSGNAGLAFNCPLDHVGIRREVEKYCFRYPGMDVLDLSWTAMHIGTRVRGPSWLTFLGQPVLGELGGAEGLRSRLHTPGTTVQQLEGDRTVITLGPWPEAGDTEQGKDLPAYRELARVLEPVTYLDSAGIGIHEQPPLRWARRFLD